MIRLTRVRWTFVAGACVAACTGAIGEPPERGNIGVAPGAQCAEVTPGPAPIRRITRFEYNNTIRDLLNDTSDLANEFVAEEEVLGFNNQASALGVTRLLAEQFMEASEAIALNAAAKLGELLPCDPAAGEDTCAKAFIESFGRRAFRRPLEAAEVDRLTKLYASGRSKYDFSTGIQLVIQAVLQSPHFLYRVEFGMPDPAQGDVVPLTHHEIASRLSYLLWSSMPDEELLAAADDGRLGTRDQIAAQARRMLDDPKARRAVANFHEQWLALGRINTINKDGTTYPAYSDQLRPLWKTETMAFLEHVIFDEDGGVADMLTAPYSMMNAELAAFYGIKGGPTGETFERVELNPDQRSGLLTHASVLAVNAKPNQSSPVHRGKFVRERLLCQILPPPPNDIKIDPPEIVPGSTTRERFAQHSTDPACSGCHKLMDPIGFGFEHYDGIGLFRDVDQDRPVDASGEVVLSEDSDGPFDGAIELAERLAASDQVRNCVAAQWFRFGYGRAEHPEDECSLLNIREAFGAANFNVKALLVALTQTDAFRYRHKVTAEGGAP